MPLQAVRDLFDQRCFFDEVEGEMRRKDVADSLTEFWLKLKNQSQLFTKLVDAGHSYESSLPDVGAAAAAVAAWLPFGWSSAPVEENT